MIGFAVLHLAPGGPLAQFALVPGMSQADIARIAHADGPRPAAAGAVLGLVHAGCCAATGATPTATRSRCWRDRLASRRHARADGARATLIAIVLGAWIGIMGAVRRYSLFDYLATIGAMVALSIPTFWFGLVVIYVFSVKLGWLPAGNRYTIGDGSFLDYAAPSDRALRSCWRWSRSRSGAATCAPRCWT